jgi:hypothetical protein
MQTQRGVAVLLGALCAAGCQDRTAQSPSPQYYRWPERMNYRMEHVTELQRDARAVQRLEVFKVLKLTVRESQYVLVYDSVLKTSLVPGAPPSLAPYLPEDTLAFYLALGRRGELGPVVAGCDPALPACDAALPSTVAMELRRFVPRLPVWPVPAGGTWMDTLRFDDTARPGGSRGTFVTAYGPARDTLIGTVHYWVVPWRSWKQAFHRPPNGAGFAPEQPAEEAGLTLIDKSRDLPVAATWAGAVTAPPDLRAIGIGASAFRTRVWLAGTYFDSVFAAERTPPPGPTGSGR